MHKTMVIALAALMLAGALTGWSGLSAAVPNPVAPELTVSIEPASQQAAPTDKEPGFTTFNGTVQVDKSPVQRFSVGLNVTVDTGWPAQASPSVLVITDTQQQHFSLVVAVPTATHADEVGHVKVTASASGTGYSVTDEAQANVTVAPYYLVMLNSSVPFLEITPEKTASFAIVVKNPGNAVDSYGLEISNAKELNQQGWTVTLDKASISNLGPNGEAEVAITARPPQGWSWDIWISRPTPIILKATSRGAQADDNVISQSFPVHAYQKGFNMPLMTLIIGIISVLVVLLVVGLVIRRQRRRKRMKALMAGEPAG
jgi:hypothetical protein